MLDFPRWKVASIVALLLALMLLAVPTFIPEKYTRNWPIPTSRVNLGLDLYGGSHLLLEADTAELAVTRLEAKRDEVSAALRRGGDRIEIGDISTRGGKLSFLVRDPTKIDDARERLLPVLGDGAGLTGQREWTLDVVDSTRFVLTPTAAGTTLATERAMEVATNVVRIRTDQLGTREASVVRQGTDRIVVEVPGLDDPQELKDLLGKTAKLEFKLVDESADPVSLRQGIAPIGSQILPYPGAPFGLPYIAYPTKAGEKPLIAVKRSAIITGEQLVNAYQSTDENNQPVVDIKFDTQGGKRFGRVTQENVKKPFAIILDNSVLSAPSINEPILGGSAKISGSFTIKSANELAIQLRSGSLPVTIRVVEERTVGPDLGRDSIRAGVLASIIATIAVITFMIVTYGRFGVYATIAVIINVIVILGMLAVIGGTLTLPGIAGFVLTIGTAVDANVLINERIREERRRGRGVVQSVELGYKEASRTIFEANVTHAISGVIMLLLGSGPVKGFAVVLLIGIVTSVFTAVVFTRMLVALWLRAKRPSDLNI